MPWLPTLLTGLLLALGSALLYVINLDHLPLHDELYHALAADGLRRFGEPRIADGLYTRGLVYTYLVAWSQELLGPSLAAARVPSVLAMATLVGVLFVWARRRLGAGAAWLGVGLFAVSPFAVDLARYCRFYAPQMLLMALAAMAVLGAVRGRRAVPRLLAAGGALLAAAAATALQPVSLLGVAGLVLFVLAATWPSVRQLLRWGPRVAAAGGVLVLVALAAPLLLAQTGAFEQLWSAFRETQPFMAGARDDYLYYALRFTLLYPTLWPLTPLLAVAALGTRLWPAALALAVFATAFVLHSIAGPKHLRYLAYAIPWLFILWGMGLAALAAPICRAVRAVLRRLLRRGLDLAPTPPRVRVLLAAVVAAVVLANPAWMRTVLLLADRPAPGETPLPDWAQARDALRPYLDRAALVITSEDVSALYYLGDFDVNLSASKLAELDAQEFDLDPRTGRPTIAEAASVARLLACYAPGVVVGSAEDWGKAHLITAPIAELIAAAATPIALPEPSRVRAYAWQQAAVTPRPADCRALDQRLPRPGPPAPP